MRGVRYLMVIAVAVVSLSVFASPRERPSDDERSVGRVVKFVKRMVRSLGDGLTLPTPAPKP
jgi:hypothetical protein